MSIFREIEEMISDESDIDELVNKFEESEKNFALMMKESSERTRNINEKLNSFIDGELNRINASSGYDFQIKIQQFKSHKEFIKPKDCKSQTQYYKLMAFESPVSYVGFAVIINDGKTIKTLRKQFLHEDLSDIYNSDEFASAMRQLLNHS
jgi:hypothetical protein